MEHYDVIIIGTGAGGGTLAHRLAPTGKRILLLERGGYLPREPENWDSQEVFGKERYLSGEEWIDRDGNAFRPHQQYFVGGNTKFYGAILFRLRERDFGEVRHHAGDLAGVAAELRRPRALLHRGRAPVPRPRRARRGPDRGPGLGPLPLPRRLARAAHPAAPRRLREGRPPPVPPAGRRRPRRDRPRGRALRALRPLRRLPVPDRRQGRRPRPVRAPRGQAGERHAAHPRARPAPGDRRERAQRDRGRGRSARRRGALQRRRGRRLVRRGQLGGAAAALGQRAPPARPGQLVGRGGPPLHGPHQLGRHRDLADPQHDEVPEDPRRQRLLLGIGRLRLPARPHPDAGQERPPHPARRRAVVRPRPRPGLHGQARDRLLADDRGPAPSRQPRHRRPRRPDPPGQGRPQHRAPPPAAGQAQGPARPAGLPRDVHPRLVGPRPAHPAGRGGPPVRDRALRRGPGDVGPRRATAGPTTSTTSTSSTRASSRRPAP